MSVKKSGRHRSSSPNAPIDEHRSEKRVADILRPDVEWTNDAGHSVQFGQEMPVSAQVTDIVCPKLADIACPLAPHVGQALVSTSMSSDNQWVQSRLDINVRPGFGK